MLTKKNTSLLTILLKRALMVMAFFGLPGKIFAQNSLEVALQIGHRSTLNSNSAPKIYAVSPDDRWVVTSDKNEHSLIVWEIKIGKIYATYPISFDINDAIFLANNEDLLINRSFIFNIHAGKVTRQLAEIPESSADFNVKTDVSLQANGLVKEYSVINKNSQADKLERQYEGYEKGFCYNSSFTIFWGFSNDRIFEYDLSNGTVVRSINPDVGQIRAITHDSSEDLLIVQGENKTCFFKAIGNLYFTYINEPLLNITISKKMTYLAGLKLEGPSNKNSVHIWSLEKKPKLLFANKASPDYVRYSSYAWFMNNDSQAIIYTPNAETGKKHAKIIDLFNCKTIWEDDAGDYSLSKNENYLIASYEFGNIKIYDTHTFKNLSEGKFSGVHRAFISPDEKYVVQTEYNPLGYSEQIALYTLPDLVPIYADIKDTIHKGSDYLNLLISPDSKELYFYTDNSKILGRFDIAKNVMRKDSLALPVYLIGKLSFTTDSRYLISSGLDRQDLIYDGKSFRSIINKKMKKPIRFTTPLNKRIFTIYQTGDTENLIQVQNTSDNSEFRYSINNFLLSFNSDKSGDKFAYCVPKISGYHPVNRIYIFSAISTAISDSLDLPQTEINGRGQLIFSNDGSKLYIGWNNLYEYDIKTKNLRKLPVNAGTQFYPVNQSANGKFLFTYSPLSDLEGAKLVIFNIATLDTVLQTSSRLYSYMVSSVENTYMKGYPDLFETEINHQQYFINTADSIPHVNGPVDVLINPFALTHDLSKLLNISPYYGLRIYDTRNYKLLNTILPADYGSIGFTVNKKYAVYDDHIGFGDLLNIYDVQKGFKKVPFIYTVGKNGEYRFFNDRQISVYETMALSPQGTYLSTLDRYREAAVNVYKFETGELVYNNKAPYLIKKNQKKIMDGVNTVANDFSRLEMSDNEKYILFDTYNGFMIKADFLNRKEQHLNYSSKNLYVSQISKSGKWVVSVGSDENHLLMVWDSTATCKQVLLQFNIDDWNRLDIKIYEDQKIFSLQKADGIYFYDLKTLKLLKQFIDPLVIAEGNDSTHMVRITLGNGQSVKYALPEFTVASAPDKPGQYRFVADGPFEVIMKDTTPVAKFLFDATNKEMMWFTPSNYYFINKESRNAIAFRTHQNLYPTSVFEAVFNRPDTVFKILDPVFHFNADLLKVYNAAYLTRAKINKVSRTDPNAIDKLPAITMKPFVNNNNTNNKDFKVDITTADNAGKIKSYNIFVNGVPLFGKNGHPVNKSPLHQQINIPLLPGKNTIEATATNNAGLNSLPATIVEYLGDSTGFKPHTYFIGVGISEYKNTDYNLNYAAKDIMDITTALHHKNPELIIDTFLNKSATRPKILAVRDQLLHTRPEDRVIFYYCGHGVRKQEYFIGTYNFSFDDPGKDGINISEIYKLLDSIPARARFVMLDACNSGQYYGDQNVTFKGSNGRAVDANVKALPDKMQKLRRGATIEGSGGAGSSAITVAEIMDDVFADFGNDYGIDVLAAAKGSEVAYETPGYKNGVFTHAMLQAVNTNLDGVYDNKPVPISSLKNYVSDLVSNLTGGSQKPVSRNENTEKDWVIW